MRLWVKWSNCGLELSSSLALTDSRYGRPGRTRTSDLFRVNLSWLGITTTHRTAGTAKTPESRTRQPLVWDGLWVGKTIDLIGGLAGLRRPQPRPSSSNRIELKFGRTWHPGSIL